MKNKGRAIAALALLAVAAIIPQFVLLAANTHLRNSQAAFSTDLARARSEALAAKAVEVITASARTGQIGDGKVFVSPITDAVRIRTGETGSDAL